MICIENTRFGSVEIEDGTVIHFPKGIIGFPEETRFVLLERARGGHIAYLQSLSTPGLAIPVMDGAVFGDDYPTPGSQQLAQEQGLDATDVVTLVVVAAHADDPRLSANLLAPIVIDAKNREAHQVVLDPRRYSAWFPIPTSPSNDASANADNP